MASEKKVPTYEELLLQNMSPQSRGKSYDELLKESLTKTGPSQPLLDTADSIMQQERVKAEKAEEDARKQTLFTENRTPAGDIRTAVGLSSTASTPVAAPVAAQAPVSASPQPLLAGASPGTKAAAGILNSVINSADAEEQSPLAQSEAPVNKYANLGPDQQREAEEAAEAFDIAYKAISRESEKSFFEKITALTESTPGTATGTIREAYQGMSPEFSRITDPAKKARVQAKVRDIIEREGGVEFWQGTDEEDRQNYIDTQVLQSLQVGPNKQKIAQIYSVIDNATDTQFDASATFQKLQNAYASDLEKQYREQNKWLGASRLPDDVFQSIEEQANQKARADIQRIKSTVSPMVFVDTGASDVVSEYLAKEDPSYSDMMRGRIVDPLFLRPSAIDEVYEQAKGAEKALPGAMMAMSFLGRGLEVLSLQEQAALQVEVLADNVRDSVEKAADPNSPTAYEVAGGFARGAAQAILTGASPSLRQGAVLSALTPEGEDPKDFLREADARLLDNATDNRDFFDTVAFTLPVLATAPWGRDAQAEAISTALEYQQTAKGVAVIAALALPDTSPLGASASAARKAVAWAAKSRRFAKWSDDLGRVAEAVNASASPEEFITKAKQISPAVGQAVESQLLRQEVSDTIVGINSTLADVGESASQVGRAAQSLVSERTVAEQNTLKQLVKNKASAEDIKKQAGAVRESIQRDLDDATDKTSESSGQLSAIQDALRAAANQTDDDIIGQAAASEKLTASVQKEAFEADQVKAALEQHPTNLASIQKAAGNDATDDDIVDAIRAIESIADSDRQVVLETYANALGKSKKTAATIEPQIKEAVDEYEAAQAKLATVVEASGEARDYVTAKTKSVEAEYRLAQATDEYRRLKDRYSVIARQKVQQEIDALDKISSLTEDQKARRDALVKALSEEGDAVPVQQIDLFRAEDAVRLAKEANDVAAQAAQEARLKLPGDVNSKVVAASKQAVDALKKVDPDINQAVLKIQEAQTVTQVAKNQNRVVDLAVQAVKKANDRATRREVLAIIELLRKKRYLMLRPEVKAAVERVLRKVKYSTEEADQIAESLSQDEAITVVRAFQDLTNKVKAERTLRQMEAWKQSATGVVEGMQKATQKLAKRRDLGWRDLGWRTGEIAKITALRSAAGNAVERALRAASAQDSLIVQARSALRTTLGQNVSTENLDDLAQRIALDAADASPDMRAVWATAQKDIDAAMTSVMADEQRATLAVMQAAWTEKSFMYQMKMFLDPMSSYIGTSSESLRNVYRGVVGTSQMYFSGLSGVVRKSIDEIRDNVGKEGQNREKVFNTLISNISTYLGAENSVTDRGAAVANVSIYQRAKRTLTEEAPVVKGDTPDVPAVTGPDRDLLTATAEAAKQYPDGMTQEAAEKRTIKLRRDADKAEDAATKLEEQAKALAAEAARLSSPDPKARPAADLVSMDEAVKDLQSAAEDASRRLEELKTKDEMDFLEQSPLAKGREDLKAAKGDIKGLQEELTAAQEALDAQEKKVADLRLRRDQINAKSLGALREPKTPDELNNAIPKGVRERVVKARQALQTIEAQIADARLTARTKALEDSQVLSDIEALIVQRNGVTERLTEARNKRQQIPDTAPAGANLSAHRGKITRADKVVDGLQEELSNIESKIDFFVLPKANSILEADKKYIKLTAQQDKAKEALSKAEVARDESIAKQGQKPRLASPAEVASARQAVQKEIDALQSGDVLAAKKVVDSKNKEIAEKQKQINKIYNKYTEEVAEGANSAEVSKLLASIKEKAVKEAQEKAEEAKKLADAEQQRLKKIIDESDTAAANSQKRKDAAEKKQIEAQEKTAEATKAREEATEAKRLFDLFETQKKEQKKLAEDSARFVAAQTLRTGDAGVAGARRLAAADVGQQEPDQTLVRLGESVIRGIQLAPEDLQGEDVARLAAKIARQALAETNTFEDMYKRMVALWAGRPGLADMIVGQDAKSMTFAAAAIIEGATRDLAIEATLREGIALVDPRAAKAMNRIMRTSTGTLKTKDISAEDVQNALLGFAKIGQLLNRMVEGKGAASSALGQTDKTERPLGVYLASIRDLKADNQTIYLPLALVDALSSEMDLMRKELDLLPSQSPNTLVNKWIVDTTRDAMRFLRTSLLIGYGVNLLGYRAKTLLGDIEQMYYAVGAKEAAQVAVLAPLQMIPFKGAVVVDAAHRGAESLAGRVKAGINYAATANLPDRVKKAVDKMGNALADFVQGSFDPTIGRIISSVATNPKEMLTIGGMTKTRAEWLEEAARQGAFDTNVEAGMRKATRDVRDMIGQVTSRRMTWDDAVEAAKERGESPYRLYLTRQRVPIKEDEILSKPGRAARLATTLVENQRALEAREADVQRTTRQMLYYRLRQQGLTENEAGEVMRRGLLDWTHGINRSVAGVIAYLPFWRYHVLSFKQAFNLFFGDDKGANFVKAQKVLRAYNSLYEGTPEEEEVALLKERAREVARGRGVSEESADLEVSNFLAAKQFSLANVPRFLRDGGQAYRTAHVSGFGYEDLGTGTWQQTFDKVDQARRDYRDPEGRVTSWAATTSPRSSIVGAMDALATTALLMDAAYAYASDDVSAAEGAMLKAGTPWMGRLPSPLRRGVEDILLARDPLANAALGGQRVYMDYGRVSPAEADFAEMLGVPLVSTADDPRPVAPAWFKGLLSLPLVGVPAPGVKQAIDAYKGITYSNPYMYDDSSLKRAISSPLSMWGIQRSYGFDPIYNQSMENAATERAAQEAVKRAKAGTRFYKPE